LAHTSLLLQGSADTASLPPLLRASGKQDASGGLIVGDSRDAGLALLYDGVAQTGSRAATF
jgi:hypothetical protein